MEEEESSSDIHSSESSSESDEETIQDIPDKDFFKTLSCLKNKDPKIYDNNVQFFEEAPIILKGKKQQSSSKQSQLDDAGDNIDANKDTKVNQYPKKNQNAKFSLKDFDNDSSSEDELNVFKKTSPEEHPENEAENEYIQFLKGRRNELEDKTIEEDLKPLHEYWNNQKLDENEQFLKDYILNKKYLQKDKDPTAVNEDLSEDERELEEQAEYEANYNFRFENDGNLEIKRFPRSIEGSLRRKNDSRSKKRAEIAQRKKEEKEKKHKEIKMKQKQKLSEIEERLQMLKELTGNVELGFKDEEIMEDFDPEKHDKKMKELFNDDYYNKEEEEHPSFNEEDNLWENDELNMDCDADLAEGNNQKLTRTQKKKLRKKKTYQDIMDIAKPSFDPKVHNDFKKYIDEYYSLDCEDFIDDIPCKFKYREVVPNDYGLSIEEILMADDNELNRWAPIKKISKRRPEHIERNEVKIYKMKAQDEYSKKNILQSLYVDPEEANNENDGIKDSSEGQSNNQKKENITENNSQINEETQEFAKNGEESQSEMQAGNDVQNQLKKSKKKKRKRNKNNIVSSQTDNDKEDESPPASKKLIDSLQTEEREEGKALNEVGISTSMKKRKKRKKKNKLSNASVTQPPDNTQQQTVRTQNLTLNQQNSTQPPNKLKNKINGKPKFKSNFKTKFGFKKKNNSVVNLSDSRLQAYGIKPKKFRGKMMYSNRNQPT